MHAQFLDTVLAFESLASLDLLMAMFEVFLSEKRTWQTPCIHPSIQGGSAHRLLSRQRRRAEQSQKTHIFGLLFLSFFDGGGLCFGGDVLFSVGAGSGGDEGREKRRDA